MRFSIMVVAFVLALAANGWAQGNKPSTLAGARVRSNARQARELALYPLERSQGTHSETRCRHPSALPAHPAG